MTRFIPIRQLKGASPLGNSYLSDFTNCPRFWFNSHYRPTLNDGEFFRPGREVSGVHRPRGIKPKHTSLALLKGRIIHEGLAELYLSGCRDGEDTGEWNIEQAMFKMQQEHDDCALEYETDLIAEDDWTNNEMILRRYYDEKGPESSDRDWPDIKVVHDSEGQPLVEIEFAVSLGYKDFVYTCRPDLIITDMGYLKVMEHKTSAAGMWFKDRIRKFETDSQSTGELFVLHALFPEEKIEGVLGNVICKKPPKSKDAQTPFIGRVTAHRELGHLERFRISAISTLQQIDWCVHGFDRDVLSGVPLETAVTRWFSDSGTRTGHCMAYRGCTYLSLCNWPGREEQILTGFIPKSLGELKIMKEGTE